MATRTQSYRTVLFDEWTQVVRARETDPTRGDGDVLAGRRWAMEAYTLQEAAERLGVSERTVRRQITSGTVQAERDGRFWRVLLPAGGQEEEGTDREVHGSEMRTASGTIGGDLEVETRVPPVASDQEDGHVQALLRPFMEELRETQRQNGWLLRENQRLRQRVADLEAQLATARSGNGTRRRHSFFG